MNGEVVDFIPIRAAHTGGDTTIRFENANVILIGDFYRNYGYPFIDINNGGSLKGMLEALDSRCKIAADPDTKLVPGHGTIIKREDIVPYRDMISAIAEKVRQLVAQGKTVQDVLAAKVTCAFDAKTRGRHRRERGAVRHGDLSGAQRREVALTIECIPDEAQRIRDEA